MAENQGSENESEYVWPHDPVDADTLPKSHGIGSFVESRKATHYSIVYSAGGPVSHNPATMGLGNALMGFVGVCMAVLILIMGITVPAEGASAGTWLAVAVGVLLTGGAWVLARHLESRDQESGRGFPAFYPWISILFMLVVWAASAKVISML